MGANGGVCVSGVMIEPAEAEQLYALLTANARPWNRKLRERLTEFVALRRLYEQRDPDSVNQQLVIRGDQLGSAPPKVR